MLQEVGCLLHLPLDYQICSLVIERVTQFITFPGFVCISINGHVNHEMTPDNLFLMVVPVKGIKLHFFNSDHSHEIPFVLLYN